jgi:polar amino acid transport system substrate-binding protein
MNKWPAYLAFVVAILWHVPARAQKTVTLATLDWPPYIGEELPEKGYVAQIAVKAFERAGYSVKIDFLPWNRAVDDTWHGSYDAYFPEYYSEEVQRRFFYSEPFPGGPVGFFKLKTTRLQFESLEDLKPYTIGVVRGYINSAEFDAANFLHKDVADNDLSNLKKLLLGRIDLAVIDKYVGFYLIKQNFPDKVGELEFLDPPLNVQDLYLCFPKNSDKSAELLKAFNAGLNKLREDHGLDRIISERGF